MNTLNTSVSNKQSNSLDQLCSECLPSSQARIEMPLQSAAEKVSRNLLKTEKHYRVAIAQIRSKPGQIEQNTQRAIEKIEEAKKAGAQLVVFPELTIPAYYSMDLQFNKAYIQDNLKALQRIKDASEGIAVVIGFVDADPTKLRSGNRPELHNSAAVIKDGKILNKHDKTHLPTYDIFDERRYYDSPRSSTVIDLGDIKLGPTICEDIWSTAEHYEEDPVKDLVDKGANLIVNLSASPFHIGKQALRKEIVQTAARENHVPVVYANLVGGYDGFDGEVIFDGRSIIANAEGQIVGCGEAFGEDLFITDVYDAQELAIPDMQEMEELYNALVMGIRDYLERCGSAGKHAVIGLSGGIDSALVAALATDAIGTERVIGITMPSQYNSEQTKGAAYQLAKNLGIQIKTVPIQEQVDAALNTLRGDPEIAELPENVAEENVQARMRMINLMFYANKMQGIMLNTGNKTEMALNNCTVYGDMAGGFSVLGDVDKDRVYELARYINARHGREVIPTFSIETPATAELKADQTDADVMGDKPEVLAPMVRDMMENKLTRAELLSKYGDQFSEELIDKILRRHDQFEWKARVASPGIRVTPRAYGIGRRMPMNHGYYK